MSDAAPRDAAPPHWVLARRPRRRCRSARTVASISVGGLLALAAESPPCEILGSGGCAQVEHGGGLLVVELQSPRASRCCLIGLTATGQ
ncbi:hypothetical protein EWW49_28005 [Pseudomonas syringae]|nr:hypothetical protein EWW49_28005 [Pseudomonas syringae]